MVSNSMSFGYRFFLAFRGFFFTVIVSDLRLLSEFV